MLKMTEQEVLNFGEEKIAELVDPEQYGKWKIEIDRRSYRRLGCCKYNKKIIVVSALYIEQCSAEDVKDTVLHEIAHILAGPSCGHNWLWKKRCRNVGARPERCGKEGVIFSKGYKFVCKECGKSWIMKRKPKYLNNRHHPKCPAGKHNNRVEYVGYVDNTKNNSSIKIAAQTSKTTIQRTNRKKLCRNLVSQKKLDSYIIDTISQLYVKEGKTLQYGIQRANCVLRDVKKENEGKEEPKFKLTSDWCKCQNFEFYSYPEDGECSCGIHKHHVHCANCGGVNQIG